jgi:amino acid permease
MLCEQDKSQVRRLVDLCLVSSLVFYAVVGILGYVAFTEASQSNILTNLDSEDLALVIARFGE